ncbi:hypothetical protein ACFW2V_13335 [Streptomyces sp. NPDC058947]|uniref:hypothetical protein n=1 Tax=Streptomyces sp. NPDC058947 TaxID=3346675 RepID=UPI00368397EE
MTLSIENVEMENGAVIRARKGRNAAHVMQAVPSMLGAFTITGLCGRPVGTSGDTDVTIAVYIDGKTCTRCDKIVAELVAEDGAEGRESGTDTRDADAFVAELFAPEIGIDGKPWAPGDNPARRKPENRPAETVAEVARKSKGERVKRTRSEAVTAERKRLAEQTARREAQGDRCDGSGEAPLPGTRVARDDHSVSVPDDYTGKHSGKCPGEGCGRIIAVSRDGGMRRHKRPEVREESLMAMAPGVERDRAVAKLWQDSAPTLPGMDDATGVTGRTHAEMTAAVSEYYANGGKVPAEVAALPDPTVKREQWAGTNGAGDTDYRGCEGKGPVEIVNPERTHGKCPVCRAYIPLADTVADDDFRIGSHFEYGVNPPANPHMSSKSVDVVEHGSIPGDPSEADKRRAKETRCERSRKVVKDATGGTMTCDGPKGCGRPGVELKRVQRKKGEAWILATHTIPGDAFRRAGADGKGERRVTPRGTGADAGKGQRDHGSVDGAATTGRQNMAPVRPGGWVGRAGTMSLPATVRPGIDPEVSGDICPLCLAPKDVAHKGMSRSARRRHSAKVGAVLADREAQREASKAREIAQGTRLTGAERRELRKAASVGSFAEGNVGGTVSHDSRPDFAPKGERKAAPRKADKVTRDTARKAIKVTSGK